MENNNAQQTHHLKIPRWADAEKIIREHSKLTQEALDSIGELEADNDELAVRRLKLEIGKKVYDTIMNEINSHLTF